MKYSKILSYFVFILMITVACTAQNKHSKSSSSIHQKWMIVEFDNFSKEELTKLKASIDFTKQADNEGRYSAFAGCNRINFAAKFPKAGQIEISQPMMTLMYCDGAMQLEAKMGKDLQKFTQYKIDGHYLTLMDVSGKLKMKLVAEAWD